MNEPLVYVLIINWNGREHLDACFSSLTASDYPNMRFLLIDNASNDGSVAYIREHYQQDTRVDCLECEYNHGWSGGNNLGIRVALDHGADYIFLLNNDIAIAPDAISTLVQQAEATPQCGCLAPKMVLFDTPSVLNSVGLHCSVVGAAWDRGIGRADAARWDEPQAVVGVCGGAMFIRAEVFKKAGLLPEDFEIYLDDLDLCMRIWSFGYTILTCPKAVIRHKFSASMGQDKYVKRKYYLNTRNRFKVIFRNFPLVYSPFIFFWVFIGEIRAVGRSFLDGQYWRAGMHAKAWLLAIMQMPGILRYRLYMYKSGAKPKRFWPLILKKRMFCPVVQLPNEGWYSPRVYTCKTSDGSTSDMKIRPMAPEASALIPEEGLRLSHVNCYPELGATDIHLVQNGKTVLELSAKASEVHQLDIDQITTLSKGEKIIFRANRIFFSEDTGEAIDIGGWFKFDDNAHNNQFKHNNMKDES